MCMYIHILYNLDAIIYNKITSIVNVIRLKLFTLISIVNKYIHVIIVYMYIPDWKWHAYKEGICMV